MDGVHAQWALCLACSTLRRRFSAPFISMATMSARPDMLYESRCQLG